MARLFKWLVVIAFVGGALTTASYAGARFTAGRFLGPKAPVSRRTDQFAFEGVTGLPGKPRAWVFTYRASEMPGIKAVQIFVSPTGRLLATVPGDLDIRLDAYERSLEP